MIESAAHKLLSSLEPLNALSPASLIQIAEKVRWQKVAAKVKISAGKETTSLMYLVQGTLAVVSGSTIVESMRAGTPRALKPIFQRTEPELFALSTSSIELLLLDKAILERLQNQETLSAYDVHDMEVNPLESELLQTVYDACQTGQLELPTLPEVALRLRRTAKDPNVEATDLSKIIQSDPIIAARVVQAANSPLYRGQNPIHGVKDAVIRLGLDTSRNLAISLAVKNTFRAKSPLLRQRMHALWEHSMEVSSLCYVMAQAQPRLNPERALLAGLVHDIGEVPILAHPDLTPELISVDAFTQALHKLRAMAGVLVLTTWQFEPDIVSVAEAAENWLRDPAPQPDYCDLVVAAQLCINADTLLPTLSLPPQDIPALKKLGLSGENQEEMMQLIGAARNDAATVSHILQD